jgi:transposase-like protein
MARKKQREALSMLKLMSKYVDSGLTQKAFCARHGFSFNTFQYWWKKYKEQSDQKPDPVFTELEVSPRPGGQEIIIRYPSGTEVRIPVG